MAHACALTKRPLEQRQPLRVTHVEILERVCVMGDDPLDRVFAGQALF